MLNEILMTYLSCRLLADTGHSGLYPASVQRINPIPGDKFIKYMLVVHLF